MTITDKVLQWVRKQGVVRPKDLAEQGISPAHLHYLHRRGLLSRSGRGIYFAPEAESEERLSLVEVSRRVPDAVLCLISALDFHALTTQIPFVVWIARSPRTPRPPRIAWPPTRLVRMSGAALTEGVEIHTILGTPVRVFCPAKTVVDCFKFRNKIGLDVALEALQDAWHKRRVTMDELSHYAEICRLTNVMRPYLESLTYDR